MTITSIGYAGSVTDAEWARLVPLAGGSDYTVPDVDDYMASSATGDRNVSISSGVAAGHGVLDENDTSVVINIPSVGSGSRWDLIALHRDWGTSTTTLVRIAGTASKTIPARDTSPGVEDDQPLWLVRVTAGQTTIQEYVDLRCFVGNGGAYANDDLVRSYVNRVGTNITIGTTRWERRLAGGLPTWSQSVQTTWANETLMKLGERDMPANINNPGQTSTSGRIYCTLVLTIAQAQAVDIVARVFWWADGNAAGNDTVRLNNGTGPILITDRMHNNNSTGGMFEVHTVRIWLSAGTHTFIIACNHESAGYPRLIQGARLTAWAVQ